MTRQELTNRYDELCKTMTSSQAYDILVEETGRKRENIKTSICRYKSQLGTQPSQLKATLIKETKKKTEEKIEKMSETMSDMLASQSERILKGNELLIKKFEELIKLGGDEFGTNSGSLNQLASALYRMQEIRDKAQMFQDSKDTEYVSENRDAIYNLYFKEDDDK